MLSEAVRSFRQYSDEEYAVRVAQIAEPDDQRFNELRDKLDARVDEGFNSGISRAPGKPASRGRKVAAAGARRLGRGLRSAGGGVVDRRAALRRNVLIAAAACAAACVPRPLFQTPSRAVTGELLVETSSSEPKTYQPTACLSGDHFYFLGVDLEDPAAATVVRVVVDPLDGPVLRLTSPAGVLRFDRNSCSTFRVSVEPTGWRVNHVRDFSGSLDLDCATANDARVSGSVVFQHCH